MHQAGYEDIIHNLCGSKVAQYAYKASSWLFCGWVLLIPRNAHAPESPDEIKFPFTQLLLEGR